MNRIPTRFRFEPIEGAKSDRIIGCVTKYNMQYPVNHSDINQIYRSVNTNIRKNYTNIDQRLKVIENSRMNDQMESMTKCMQSININLRLINRKLNIK